ncbi:Uncharacterized protein APZ42_008037 [Daphnia magna]|uniref:Uncharacterized protein n=1 Tax=Daphnia magna TaxID=35525 RepID=A0A164EWY4_9CRUS|nr:Uncharacterized protein APZ42_008037 [Daphnia magna]
MVHMEIISSKQSQEELLAITVDEPASEDDVISDSSEIQYSYMKHEEVNAVENISAPLSPETVALSVNEPVAPIFCKR